MKIFFIKLKKEKQVSQLMGKMGLAQLYDNEDDDDDYNGLC